MRLVLIAALAACGSKNEPAKADKPAGTKPEEPPPGPATTPPSIDKPVRMVRPPAADNFERGMCKFTLSGGMTGEYTSGGKSGSVLASYWVKDAARRITFKDNEEGLIVNCGKGNDQLSFTARVKNKDELPYGPGKYELGQKKGPIHILGSIQGASLLGGEGTFEITAYDAEHIAGTFEFTADKRDILGKKVDSPVVIKGSFDYKCPQPSCK